MKVHVTARAIILTGIVEPREATVGRRDDPQRHAERIRFLRR